MFSKAEENYLKAIFHLTQEQKGAISTNAIAEKLEMKPSSVTDMVKRLSGKEMLTYVKYKGTTLTEQGRAVAAGVIRKHRLWEVFLVNTLNFQWDEVHEIAEQLEHIQSSELVERLDAFLGFPEVDPHGDPIPDADGNIKRTEKKILFELEPGDRGFCVGLAISDNEFLSYLDKKHIRIGTPIEVLEKEDFDRSMTLKIKDQQVFVSQKITDNIYIQI